MEAIHSTLLSQVIRDNITENVLENVKTVGCSLKYFIKNHTILERVSTRVELMVYQHHFDLYRDEMIQLGYKKLIQKVRFDGRFNSPIPVGFLPRSIVIEFGDDFNQSIAKGVIPDTVEELVFAQDYSQKFEIGVIPQGVKSVTLGNFWNSAYVHPFEIGTFPSTLEKLVCQTIDNAEPGSLDMVVNLQTRGYNTYFPKNLTTLHVTVPDNATINWIPSTVTDLTMKTKNFDDDDDLCPIIQSLPQGLTKLKLSCNFRTPFFVGLLPESLRVLDTSDSRINQRFLSGILPHGLETLTTSHSYKAPLLPGQLPSTLLHLVFGADFANDEFPIAPGTFPAGLQTLDMKKAYDFNSELTVENLPRSLTKLVMRGRYSHPITPGLLPDTLVEAELTSPHSIPVGAIPDSIKKLTFSDTHQGAILAGSIPESVEEVYIGDAIMGTNVRLACNIEAGTIPATCKKFIWYTSSDMSNVKIDIPASVHFECHYTSSKNRVPLPDFITHVNVIFESQLPAQGFFPQSVQQIKLSYYPHELPVGVFPEGGKDLDLRGYYEHPIAPGVIPSSVVKLGLPFDEKYISTNSKHIEINRITQRGQQIRKPCENMIVEGSIPSSVKTLILEGSGETNDAYNGPERTIIYHINQNDNNTDYFDIIGN